MQEYVIISGKRNKASYVACCQCYKRFLKSVSQIKKSKFGNHFCSRECFNSFQNKQVQIFCHCCGKLFHIQSHKLKLSKSGLYFCSRECKDKSYRELVNGIKEFRCSSCGKKIERPISSDPNRVKCTKCQKNRFIVKTRNGVYLKRVCKLCGNDRSIKECKRRNICEKYKLLPSLHKYFGFDLSTKGSEKFYDEWDRIVSLLNDDYWNKELSISDIVEKYNMKDVGTTGGILKSLGIKSRNISESIRLAYKQGKINPTSDPIFNSGVHTAWNNKKVFYRSSYELDYAKELDKQKIDYEMETLKIQYFDSQKKITRTAIPDFYLPDENKIVEIKGKYYYDERNMKDKFNAYRKYGYKTELILEHESVQL